MAKKINPLNHELVPKHIVLSEKEKEELFKKYNIIFFQLPHIAKTDAAIKDLNAKSGDVIKIVRKSRTAGEVVYFRGV